MYTPKCRGKGLVRMVGRSSYGHRSSGVHIYRKVSIASSGRVLP